MVHAGYHLPRLTAPVHKDLAGAGLPTTDLWPRRKLAAMSSLHDALCLIMEALHGRL